MACAVGQEVWVVQRCGLCPGHKGGQGWNGICLSCGGPHEGGVGRNGGFCPVFVTPRTGRNELMAFCFYLVAPTHGLRGVKIRLVRV